MSRHLGLCSLGNIEILFSHRPGLELRAGTPDSTLLCLFFSGRCAVYLSATLGWKLFGLLASSAIVGLGLRRLIGITRIERYRLEIDGGNIVGFFIFAAALMGDVASGLLADPLLWFGLLAAGCLAFVIFFRLIRFGVLAYWPRGGARRRFYDGAAECWAHVGRGRRIAC